MFVGHLGVSLAAKAVEPRAPLSALVAATYGLDLLWPFLLLAGVETVSVAPGNTAFTPLDFESYPWSHSLLLAGIWGSVTAAIMYTVRGNRRVALLVGAVVISHWLLDFVTHRPDLPLWPGGPKFGLGLWNSTPATILIEGGLFLGAIWVYTRAHRPRDAVGRWALWALVALTGGIWITQPWSPPPPSSTAVAGVTLTLLIFPWWTAWIERHR
ncbi:MAG TPA: hypothetical protein QGG47_03490 [Acidobacteriota bacterium]|nr:hypothetical protein [Acidobacteriota bacterium]